MGRVQGYRIFAKSGVFCLYPLPSASETNPLWVKVTNEKALQSRSMLPVSLRFMDEELLKDFGRHSLQKPLKLPKLKCTQAFCAFWPCTSISELRNQQKLANVNFVSVAKQIGTPKSGSGGGLVTEAHEALIGGQ